VREFFSPVWAIALNTFRETVRDRVLYAFVAFAFLLTGGGLVLGSLSIGQDLRVLEDFGIAIIAGIGGIIAVFLGTSLVYKEIDRRTIYLIVSKPIDSWQFVAGKYLGLSLCILVVTAMMGSFLLLTVAFWSSNHALKPELIASLGFVYLELLFIVAVATFFSTFATPIMSTVFTLAVWLISHMGQALKDLGRVSTDSFVRSGSELIYWILPDLARLTQIRNNLMAGVPPPPEVLSYLLIYIIAYTIFLLSLATVVTKNREFS
jgi:ABC-type transport system involved in multi-copper enzyme maturation permease subunit